MGGHGGLNILPQKRWNVYRFDNREKVRKDEEAAAREEQLKREDAHRRDAEFRLDRLRQCIHPSSSTAAAAAPVFSPPSDSRHINLFDGLDDFSSLAGANEDGNATGSNRPKRDESGREEGERSRPGKKWRKEEAPAKRVMSAEDEKYRLGYGLAGIGVKAPWYLSGGTTLPAAGEPAFGCGSLVGGNGSGKKSGGKKTVEEMREERMRREKKEKERERELVAKKRDHRGFSRRRP